MSAKSSARLLVTAFRAALDALYAYDPPEVLSFMDPICKSHVAKHTQPLPRRHASHSLCSACKKAVKPCRADSLPTPVAALKKAVKGILICLGDSKRSPNTTSALL